ncbi:MAG: carbon-nitrogen hydrolase [Planctomycetota bacterium]|nr:carbon-nitrogen hydrolase [Planctomycetota bacterium]
MKTNLVQVAALQTSCSDDRSANLEQSIEQIRTAAKQGAELVCLQELFHSRYFCQTEDHQYFDLAESIPGPTSEAISKVAAELNIVVLTSVFERRAAGLFHNTAIVFDRDGSLAGKYRKMHIPDDPGYYEKFYFTPGDQGFVAFDTSLGSIGVCICWDQWFPEAARLTALAGAQILVYPTAIGWLSEDKQDFGASQRDAWKTVMRSHAIANGIFVVAANRVGFENNIEFWGHSMIIDPYGNVMAQGSSDQPEIVTAACNLESIETARTHWPFLRDRRIDAYSGLDRRMIDE